MRIRLADGTEAELALPEGEPARGVVLHSDMMGLRPLFDDHCARLARDYRWAVCAPEPFTHWAGMPLEERQAAAGTLDDTRQLVHLVAAADALSERGCQRVGVLGFCVGGMYTYKAAALGRFDRAVSFYGMIRLPENWRGPGQGEPLDALARPQSCPLLALLGGRDPFTPPADVEALGGLGPHVTVVVYPDAEHGFVHDPARPTHRPDDAADAWRRAAEFFR